MEMWMALLKMVKRSQLMNKANILCSDDLLFGKRMQFLRNRKITNCKNIGRRIFNDK